MNRCKTDAKRRSTHNVIDSPPDMLDVMANPVEHPVLADEYNVLIHVAASENWAPSTAAMKQVYSLHHAQATRLIVNLEGHLQRCELPENEKNNYGARFR
jgi:hypothetical protein